VLIERTDVLRSVDRRQLPKTEPETMNN